MYTLKVRWTIFEAKHESRDTPYNPDVVEELVEFTPARQVTVHGEIPHYYESDHEHPPTMGAWEAGTFVNYLDVTRHDYGKASEQMRHAGRLLAYVDEDGRTKWLLASAAWLLGERGGTIERLVT